ncbi:centromere-associated protein E isoform X6 [Xiphias gladius]|uniref:centromere-associated protein E isoform X6 n=1 Tax=Xiphias gladius TaxID=8245 RepID=UPI001A9A0FCB|nr:centromere-associated protein E isoform X6 [Xiphias gladius]
MTEESAVKVCVRVRPLIAREESAASENPEPVQLFWKADKKSIHQIDDGNSTKSFSFDRVFTAEETTNQLYQDIAKPLVVSTVEGYNGTIFAYGQTSSGKTFTMMGSDHIPGVIPVAVEDVFQTIKNCPKKEFLLRVSYMEIYNETVTDLLVDSWKRKPLEVRETISKNIYVADLTEELVTSPTQALAWIRKGEKNRHYGKTKMNQRSSRSHAIFRMILESRERSDPASGENADGAIIVSHLNLVDLAGSERASQTGAEGTRFKEGCNINRSLFTLGQVIKKLTDESQKGFTNYRDSKLTRILQNSLGGNAKTVIICTITPVTLDETLSTLQFASTAKKMKNDPHVTEVSDDGALLKRYRNEIVDLKRRLHEVSSVTQTTATEKEVLAQLLQEKDQLQREQEDRIKNLTKLLVTSSNLIPAKKMPKRRVTWGGKMLRLARPSACDGGSSDLSFADPFTRKRKADRSCLMELGEDDEDFDSHWEISDEPPDEMEMSQSCVTVRSFGDSPKDFVSPDRMRELSGKVSNLELQLELESQQKEEAMTKVETLDDRVAELQLQLQTEAQQKQGALEKIQTIEQRAAELEQQQRAEAQQKLQAMDKAEMLELKVADLERQLEEQRCGQTEPDEQMRREFAETIQLCETLASEKDMVVAERDYLKQELGMFIEQTESLEKEKAALSQELEEKREMNEFKSLEEECRKEHENELQNEISSLKKAIESSELQCQELQNKLETLSEELKKKTEFAEELQSMSGKDLVQEVAKLRRSLDDAEGVSRDTKKEWAVLRSENLALTEMNVILTANHEKMEAEVNSLRFQLETEKSHYRKMQSDLQKELNVVFDENTKLTILLDGKVPKNLLDSVELERTVASLNKELTASRKAEGILRAQLEELASFQTLPEKVDNLMKQLDQLNEEFQRVRVEKEALLSEKNAGAEQMEKLLSTVTSLTAERDQLRMNLQQNVDLVESLSQELQCVRCEKETLPIPDAQGSAEEITKLLSTVASVTAERDQLKMDLQENVEMMIENQEELRKTLEKNRSQKLRIRQLEAEQTPKPHGSLIEMNEQLKTLQTHIQSLTEERESLLFEKTVNTQTSTEEKEKLLCRVSSLSEERDQLQETLQVVRQEKNQLKAELEHKTEMMQYELQQQLSSEAQSLKEEQEDQRLLQIQQLENHLENTKEELSQLKSDLKENIDLMIENQEELRVSHEKIRVLQDEINVLRNQKAELESRPNSGDDAESIIHLQELRNQIQSLTEELDSVRAERDSLLSESTADTQTSTEEMEKLLCRVSFLSEERDQLQETLQGLRQEKNHLKAELEDKIEILQTEVSTTQELLKSVQEELREQKQMNSDLQKLSQEKESSLIQQIRTLTAKLENTKAERDSLCSEKEASCQTSTEEMEKLLCSVSSLSEERDQLQETLQGLRQEKNHLKAELEDKIEILQTEVSTTQELLKSVQEELREQKQMNSDLQKLSQEKESSLIQQIRTLTAKLENTKAERDSLCSEKEASCQTSTEQMERLLCSVTSLSEERNQLQETLQALRQEKNQLRTELENRMETFSVIQEKLSEQEQLNVQQQSERGKQEAKLQQEVQQLEEQLQMYRERQTGAKAEADALQQLLSEANTTISALREQLSSLDQHATGVKETVSSRLLDSTVQLQESFRGLQQFVDNCSTYSSTPMDKALRVQSSLKDHYLISLPKPTMDAYTTLCQLGLQTAQSLGNIIARLRGKAQAYRNLFEELVKKDLAVYEERRLQDVLLCRVQAPSYSVKEEELHTLWEHRLTELLDKRQLYQQKMASILEKLWANMDSYPNQLSAEIREREMFNEQLQAVFTTQPINFSRLDSILSCELDRRSAVAHAKKMALQGITDEQSGLFEELKLLEAQADSQLREEKSKRSTLLQALEGAPLKTELSLLKDNQQLVLQLQQTEEKVRVLRVQNEQLEEAQVKANNRVSNHKQATQLLQTELQDSRAQIEEKENAIQTLRSKLRESEKNASPSAVELEKVRTKLFKMEVEMSSASDKHQLEIQRLTTVLNEKEDSLRKLREALRRSQQRGEESFLQGEDLHAKLTNPRGLVIKSSILLEKTRLEEEVKRLQLKITELESLTSTQQGEISKWKSRTAKLKMKNKADVNKPSSPCTPTKSGLPMTSESPRKLPASPKVSLLNSPKSRFFDVGGSSELLSRTCPKQFFDNSSLGTIPEVSHVPDTADAEKVADADAGAVAAAGAARKDEWWPQSPKQDDMCSTQ